jgi:4-amino-4-deoxy-L-arabinose transferase-like glycosyltransferase
MSKALLVVAIIISSLLRLSFLHSHIPSAYGDEVAIAYNAYSILKTGKDEFGEVLPLQFRSWGDQKNPVYIYTVSAFQLFLGMNIFSVRLPSALSGILAVLLTYLITKQIIKITDDSTPKKTQDLIASLSALLLAVNPWHLHISRGGYEANMALTLGLAGLYYLLKWYQENAKFFHKYIIISTIFFTLAMYTYYTSKMFIPLMVSSFWAWFIIIALTKSQQKIAINHIKHFLLFSFIIILTSVPYIYLALFSSGQARFSSINIFANPEVATRVIAERSFWQGPDWLGKFVINKPVMWARDFTYYFLDNLSVQYWYIFGDSTLRYTIGNHGVFYTLELPFFLLGLCFMFAKNKKMLLILTLWIIISVLPTALVGKAYALRSLALLPIPVIFVAYGLVHAWLNLSQFSIIKKIYSPVIASLFLLSITNFLLRYAYAYPTYAYYWYDGVIKDALDYAKNIQDEVDYVVITNEPGKTEIYYAFYNNIDPKKYQQQSANQQEFANKKLTQIDKYYFGDVQVEKLPQGKKVLVIAPPLTIGGDKIIAKDDKRVIFDAKVIQN